MSKVYYKFIFLIIDSDTPYNEIYKSHRERWIKSFKYYKDAKYFFIKFNPSLESDILIEDNYIIFKGNESYIPGILNKTLKAMELIYNFYDFDYLIRTNLSSCWQPYLLKNVLIKTDSVYAVIGNYNNIQFPSGAGIIIPNNIVLYILNNINDFTSNFPDDVEFGAFFSCHNIPLISLERCDYFINNISNINTIKYLESNKNNNYHYRILYDRGEQDSYINSVILNCIFN